MRKGNRKSRAASGKRKNKSKRKARRSKRKHVGGWRRAASFARRHPFPSALAFLALALAAWLAVLDWQVTSRFDGRRWDLPAHVYARPLELFAGRALSADALDTELARLGYRAVAGHPRRPGTFRRYRNVIELVTRPFAFWDGAEPARPLVVTFDGARIGRLTDGTQDVAIARLEPLMIGSLFAEHGEDRLIVAPQDVPPLLSAALVAVEDRRFYHHFGIDPLATLRALVANLKAGGIAQGGSTLTQQLVKNYFLDNRQTLWRKLKEALMAVILEAHYDKQEILNAYVNEVYLGQQGNRAIHGFGLAAQFWFSRPLAELEPHQIALLVAMVRGPGYYDPVRFSERARARRDRVLAQLAEQGALSAEAARAETAEPLDLWDAERYGMAWYPAYLDIVRRQLAADYRDRDLTREGLRVFTALDPMVQAAAERELAAGLERLETARGLAGGELAGAVVVTAAVSGEVLAVVGGRRAGFAGFNRALDARRPIGSLVKPAVYLAALESGRYTLASTVDDRPVELPLPNGNTWTPANFEKRTNGSVTLVRALAESLNLATVNLGLDVGVERVAALLERLGADPPVRPLPSLLLGAVGLAPVDVAEVYGTLANGGFHTPLRAVRSVLDAQGTPLDRYGLEVAQVVDPAAVQQLEAGLVAVMRRGTGRGAAAWLPGDLAVAGKTGTSDELRDAWFAGYSGEHVMVVWVGRDDNAPTGLTGASGALPIWARILAAIGTRPLAPATAPELAARWVDYATGAEVSERCEAAVRLMLPRDARLTRGGRCGLDLGGTLEWLRDTVH
ncbi:MAG TPA: penicillin-binding protein 1B [Woeseiaceae bacterium]